MPVNIRTFPVAQRAAGIYNLPQVALGQVTTKVEIGVSRADLPAEEFAVASILLEGSPDSGATWIFLGGTIILGGVSLDKNGDPALESTYAIELLTPAPATHLLRGRVAIFVTATAGMRMTVYP